MSHVSKPLVPERQVQIFQVVRAQPMPAMCEPSGSREAGKTRRPQGPGGSAADRCLCVGPMRGPSSKVESSLFIRCVSVTLYLEKIG